LVSPGASVNLFDLERSTFIMIEICSAAQKETITKDFDVVMNITEVKQMSNCSSPQALIVPLLISLSIRMVQEKEIILSFQFRDIT
jgi:hypothetical protein